MSARTETADDLPTRIVGPVMPTPTNLDFESGADTSGFPTDWVGGGPGFAIARDSSNPHGGHAAMRIRWARSVPPADTLQWGVTTQCATVVDAWRGKRVRLTGFLRTTQADSDASLWFRVDTAGKTAAFDNMEGRVVTGTTPWRPYTIVLDVAPKADRACYGALLSGAGTVWIDDLTFDVVDSTVPTTGSTPPRP